MTTKQLVITVTGQGESERIFITPIPKTMPAEQVLELLDEATYWTRKQVLSEIPISTIRVRAAATGTAKPISQERFEKWLTEHDTEIRAQTREDHR